MSEANRLEEQLANAKLLQVKGEKINRLFDNADFKEIILNDFCLHECARYAQESGDPALTEAQRADAMALAQAAGHLLRYLAVNQQMIYVGIRDIEELEAAVIDARAEEAGE